MKDVPVTVWEERVPQSEFMVDIDNLIRSFPDEKQLETLRKKLISGHVMTNIYKGKNPQVDIHEIKVEIWYPTPNPKNVHSRLYKIIISHSKLPLTFKMHTPILTTKVGTDFYSFYDCVFGVSKKIPNVAVRLSFYPYNFAFLKKFINLPKKPILVQWESKEVL